jgi:hypothetical protein
MGEWGWRGGEKEQKGDKIISLRNPDLVIDVIEDDLNN